MSSLNFSLFRNQFFETNFRQSQGWWNNYTETHYRLAEFLVGVIAGYIMFSEQLSDKSESNMKNQILLITGWSLSIGFFWFHIFEVSSLPPKAQIVYQSISRELWACAICWIIIACHCFKSGGIIRDFLSHPSWQPLSKLTLSTYLLHMPYLLYTKNYYEKGFGFLWLLHIDFGDICLSILAAVFAFVLIEAPIGNLVNSMLNIFKTDKNSYQKLCEESIILLNK